MEPLLFIVLVVVAVGVATAVIPAQVRRAAAAEREATVRAAVDTVVAVAADRLGQQVASGERELELRNQAFDLQLDSVHAELRRVSDAVATWQQDRARSQGELVAGLAEASKSTAALAATTGQLREALASPSARGQWGERMADDVLRLAGFVEGVNYVRQRAVAGGGVPDLTFLLPGDQVLHMDVKFPIANYLRSLDAGTEPERQAAEAAFVRDVRARIKELTGRGYIQRGTTLPYVLLFLPNESVYAFVHQRDPGLVDAALSQQVVLCSPFTLFAVLAVVRQAAESLAVAQGADEVVARLAAFQDQWERFTAQLDLVGKRLDSAHVAFDDLAGPRRRQLERHLDGVAGTAGTPAGVRKVAG